MTRTSQLDAHYAVIQLDNLRRQLIMSFQPTAEMLVAEVRERAPGQAGRQRLRELLTRYRASVLELDATLVALRAQCGTDADDLPHADDDDVQAEATRIQAAHVNAARQGGVDYRQCSAALAAAADEALDTLRYGGAL
jgi:hypothetical protein